LKGPGYFKPNLSKFINQSYEKEDENWIQRTRNVYHLCIRG
jgi:hypothetical protein